ncbi:hypothetical protein [Paenibacillus graminis]|uniref:Uncharacterized protein n=1 Tax=Paenibacillus graminis TaxID=189425 RepID=A0A089M9Y0_9BACL|nr:hypothetical protein [Paenibacillus graminis]AIQ70062.1 hypothetical protein PGRAT_22230 [Paenibacillus graminis]MEC0169041.1 hypothetical protein [Paenibacillus graminis]
MAHNNNNFGYGNTGNGRTNGKSSKDGNGAPLETEELDAEDYAIIAAGLTALGDIFAFLSLVKAKQVTKETGGQAGVDPILFIQSRKKKAAKRKNRPLR